MLADWRRLYCIFCNVLCYTDDQWSGSVGGQRCQTRRYWTLHCRTQESVRLCWSNCQSQRYRYYNVTFCCLLNNWRSRNIWPWMTTLTFTWPCHSHRPLVSNRALSCAATSVFLQLHLNPAVSISFSRSFLQVFFDRTLLLCPSDVYCNAWMTLNDTFIIVTTKWIAIYSYRCLYS